MASNITHQYRGPRTDDGPTALLTKLLAVNGQRVTGTALALANRTSTTQSNNIDCTGFRGIVVYLRIAAVPGTDTVRVTIRGVDPVSGFAMILVTGPNYSGIEATTLVAGPGFGSPTALPDQIRIEVTHSPSPSGSFQYSVGYCLIP